MQLDIGGFLTSVEFLGAIASAVSLMISTIIMSIFGGIFGSTS